MADPGFLRGGALTPKGRGPNLLFGQFFPKTAWKWRNFAPEGGASLTPPLDPPLVTEPVWVLSWVLSVCRDAQLSVHCDLNVFGTSQPRIDVCSLNSYSQSIEPSCFMFSSRYNSFPFSHPVPVTATLTKSYLWLAIHHVRHLQTGWNTFPDPYQYITQKHLY